MSVTDSSDGKQPLGDVGASAGVIDGTNDANSQPGPGGHFTIDPAELAGTGSGSGNDNAGGSTGRRGRGRPRGSRKNGQKSSTLDLDGISSTLFSIHAMLAGMTSVSELAIDTQEAKLLASGIQNVARHYDIGEIPQKTIDWINLFGVVGAVYGTRFFAVRMRYATEKKQRAQTGPQAVDPITGQVLPFKQGSGFQ